MKMLFHEYKTPSMAECEQLGCEIGLHKRVVQVWFQNARAKERKAKVGGTGGKESVEGVDPIRPPPTQCIFCNVIYSPKVAFLHSFAT